MSIMNTSVSGMAGNTAWLNSISQNVSNSNTTGYKDVETEFLTLVDETNAGSEPGMGVSTSTRTLNSLQGGITSTSTSTDLAIQGAGFFIVQNASGSLYLTRNGSFTPDVNGNLVNSSGGYLMGYDTQTGGSDPTVNSLSGLQMVNVTSAGETATPSTSGTVIANLPSTAVAVAAANLPSTNSASSVYTNETSLVAYDNLGNAHTLDVYFTNTGSNSWQVAVFDHANAASGGGFPYSSGPLVTQTLNFSATTGSLTSGTPLAVPVPNGQTLNLDLSNMTQFAASFGVSTANVNGNAPATLTGTSFNPSGQLSFQYSDGASRVGYKIPLGNVESPENLTSLSGGFLLANAQSGSIAVGSPNSGGLGSLVPSSLESSTVDLATELTDMIQAQSAYEANSKVFQTGANIFDVLNHLQA